jgi:type I restriction enzyme S subunit
MKPRRLPLGELCTLIKGTSPISRTPPGPYPLITTGEDHRTADKFQFDGEAVCIPLISSTGHGHASLKRIHHRTGKFALGSLLAAALIKDPSVLSATYLTQYLSFTKDELIVPLMTGAANMSISIDRLASVPIELPSLADQVRIVDLLSEADEVRKLRGEASRRTSALLPALFHDTFGRNFKSTPILVSLEHTAAPRGWRWSRLLDIARLATGHTPSRKVPEYWNGSIPWISLADIRALDGIVALETSQSVTDKGIENSSAVKLPKGTVCFSRTASVGFVTQMGREMCTSQDFVNWVCSDKLEPTYLMSALMQSRDYLRSLASGSTHKTIYFPTVEQLCVLVPPIELQYEFCERAVEIRELQIKQATNETQLNALYESLRYQAFRGQLHLP